MTFWAGAYTRTPDPEWDERRCYCGHERREHTAWLYSCESQGCSCISYAQRREEIHNGR